MYKKGFIIVLLIGFIGIFRDYTNTYLFNPQANLEIYRVAPFSNILSDIRRTKYLRIMPLGDSLTSGVSNNDGDSREGYRGHLDKILRENKYYFEFVGYQSERSGKSVLRYEGGEGYLIGGDDIKAFNQIYSNIERPLEIWKPNIILLLIGTNDLLKDEEDPTILTSRFQKLVNKIFSTSPLTEIYVGSLSFLKHHPYLNLDKRDRYNSGLREIVLKEQIKGRKIYFVDFSSSIMVEDLESDLIHPNENGYKKMAEIWFRAITSSEPK